MISLFFSFYRENRKCEKNSLNGQGKSRTASLKTIQDKCSKIGVAVIRRIIRAMKRDLKFLNSEDCDLQKILKSDISFRSHNK